jgi:hypothetical protein
MHKQIISNIESTVLNYKIIGLLVSGGFDSTLVSYLVHDARARLNTDNIFEYFTVPRYDDSVIHANRIIDFIDDKFNVVSSIRHIVGDPDLHHSQQVRSGIRDVLNKYEYINVLLVGDNVTPTELPGGPPRGKSNQPKIYQPVHEYTKDVLVQIAMDMNLIEIMKITHTCTESKTLRCNLCWQCRERAWAFNKCNYTDPGTM